MGLFDWLKPKNRHVEILADLIWLTAEAKFAGIAAEITKFRSGASANATDLVLVAHFRDCFERLQALTVGSESAGRHVVVTTADRLTGAAEWSTSFDESRCIQFLVGERHPLRSHDATIVDFANGLPCRSRVVHYLSLDDPVLRRFAGEWVQGMLKKLGMSEDEAIQSPMVARRVEAAQHKFAETAFGDAPADSAEEWIQRNCPE